MPRQQLELAMRLNAHARLLGPAAPLDSLLTEDEYLNLLRLFHAESVDEVIAGGYTVIAHDFPRTSNSLN